MNFLKTVAYIVVLITIEFHLTNARIHHLSLVDDNREEITISTFGYLTKGYLQLEINSLSYLKRFLNKDAIKYAFAFVLEKSTNGGYSIFKQTQNPNTNYCSIIKNCLNADQSINTTVLQKEIFNIDKKSNLIALNLDLVNNKATISRIGNETTYMRVSQILHMKTQSFDGIFNVKPSTNQTKLDNQTTHDAPLLNTTTTQQQTVDDTAVYNEDHLNYIKLNVTNQTNLIEIRFKVEININEHNEEGLYLLQFFNCYQTVAARTSSDNYDFKYNLTLSLAEKNEDSYLSAGEMPLPSLYLTWAILYFLASVSWIYILKTSKGDVFKVHYLMLSLVCIKSISLVFQTVNLHYIAVYGKHETVWAILFYITYVLKGLLMIISILLVGAGWTLIKHILTENERRLFVIIIPLQILAITAYIFLEEKEEGEAVYFTWRQLFFTLDLICCGAIIFPIVWSIKHLEQASKTDGKAAVNLQKLKLFRHFYLIVICYIYFTRIIGYLLQLVVPFRYEWLDKLCVELVTFLFFALTAYKFQPARNNPYLQLSQNEYSLENGEENNGDEDGGEENVLFDETQMNEILINTNDNTTLYSRKQQLQQINEEEYM